jgi:hypothetical protein
VGGVVAARVDGAAGGVDREGVGAEVAAAAAGEGAAGLAEETGLADVTAVDAEAGTDAAGADEVAVPPAEIGTDAVAGVARDADVRSVEHAAARAQVASSAVTAMDERTRPIATSRAGSAGVRPG